jgi:SAM-dependent methyltransferase
MTIRLPFEFDDAAIEALLPPDGLIEAPGGNRKNFPVIGKFYVNLWWQEGLFDQNSTVLDIGCSTGRMAIPMTQILSKGQYTGFDVVKQSVDFCSERITPVFKNFNFDHFDTKSTYYNRNGTLDPTDTAFPYITDEFDFIWATSVFTHMGSEGAFKRYIMELSYVLKKRGRAFLTFFLKSGDKPGACHHFPFAVTPNVSVFDLGSPDIISAYDEHFLARIFTDNDLRIDKVIRGSWSTGVPVEPYQDLFFLTKL